MAPDEIDLRQYLGTLWKWRWAVILLTSVAVAVSGVFSYFVLSPVYETAVTLSVANAAATTGTRSDDSSITDSLSRIQPVTLNTYMSEITNAFFLRRVLDKVGLQSMAASALQKMTTAQVIRDTNLIQVKVQNTDKALAATIANTIASEFVQFISETNQERMAKSLQFLEEQKESLKVELQGIYQELSSIQAKPDNAASLSRDISARTALASSLRQELSRVRLDRSVYTAEISRLEGSLVLIPPMLPPEEEGLLETPNPAYAAHIELIDQRRERLLDSESRIYALENEIAFLESSLTTLETKIVLAQNEEAVLRANLARTEATLGLLDTKIVEAKMAHSVDLGETTISITSPALEPHSPVKPRKMLNMAVAGVLGGFVSILLVFVLEYMDNTVKTKDDVQKHLGLATLGVIPLFDRRSAEKSRARRREPIGAIH